MGVFKKKPDPISERARALNQQIEALAEEIRRLNTQPASAPGASPPSAPARPTPAAAISRSQISKPSSPPSSQPRLRSTTLPRSATSAPNPFNASAPATFAGHEAVVDVADQGPLQQDREADSREHFNDLGVRKYNLQAAWTRFKNNFRGPMASNPKLVNYLAAGSIQGLRPLRYEKRIARNRFLVFVGFLVVLLWGLIWIFMRH
jgi:hypothetical protein